MHQLSGRVLTEETRRGVPDLLVTAIGSQGGADIRIGAVHTDADGRFDLRAVLEAPIDGLAAVRLTVANPSGEPTIATTPARPSPAAVETFQIHVPEKALAAAGVPVPTGLPLGLSDPRAMVARATIVADRRRQLADQLAAAAAERVAGALAELRETEGRIREALLGLPAASPDARPSRIVPDGKSVRAATLASIRTALDRGIRGATQRAALALTRDELDALAPDGQSPPAPGDELDAAKVDRLLFGPDTGRDALVRTRLDVLRAECERRTRRQPAGNDLPAPQPDPGGPLTELDDAVKILIDAAARGVVLRGDRDTPGTLAQKLAELSVKGGAADEPAYFDFSVLATSFEHLWKREVDAHVIETAAEVYDELRRAGGAPPLDGLPKRSRLFDALRARGHAVVTAGLHAAESAALTGFVEVPDFDLLGEERRVRTRDHRGGDHREARAAGRPRVRDHRDRPRTPAHTPAPPAPVRLKQLLEELDARMREPYRFEVFAADDEERSINFGVLFTYRQRWTPQAYQAGPLARTVTLAPREERAFTVRHVAKKTTTTTHSRLDEAQQRVETTDAVRDVADIVNDAKTSLGFRAEGSASGDFRFGEATQSWGVTRDAERSSQETRQAFREAVRKATQEHRTSRKVEIAVTESVETVREETGKLVNPNDEIPVTYLFFELQRRYRVSETLHRLIPVILVAQEVPAPHEITRGWLLQHDWMLEQALLDESFQPSLAYLADEAAGAEVRLVQLKAHLELQRGVVEDLKEQLLSFESGVSERYRALEEAMRRRVAVVREQDQEGWLEKAGELFFGEDTSIEGARAREEAAQEAWEREVRAQREARDRLAGAITALEAATRDYVEAEATFQNQELGVLRLRVHVKQNILHYMQAIWDHEPRDQRVFRLYDTPVPRLDGAIRYHLVDNPGAPSVPPLWEAPYMIQAQLAIDADDETFPLGEIADLDRPIGYRGNYMIFPLKRHNPLTRFLSVPYADTLANLRDPGDAAHLSLGDLDRYLACLRDDEREALAPKIDALYDHLLAQPFPNEEDVIVPSGSLFIEALPGTAPVLEDFKLLHRAVDVTKAAAEARGRDLENLRYAARILARQLGDPEIETVVVADRDTSVLVPGDEGRRGDGREAKK
jgi:hypothetical protein